MDCHWPVSTCMHGPKEVSTFQNWKPAVCVGKVEVEQVGSIVWYHPDSCFCWYKWLLDTLSDSSLIRTRVRWHGDKVIHVLVLIACLHQVPVRAIIASLFMIWIQQLIHVPGCSRLSPNGHKMIRLSTFEEIAFTSCVSQDGTNRFLATG